MSTLGIFHTVIGVIAVAAGLRAFYKFGMISKDSRPGRIYIVGTIIAGVTAFGLSKTGSLNEAHILTALTLLAVGIGLYVKNDLVRILAASVSFFLSLIPASVETLTRLPVGAPIAADQNSPVVQGTIGVWLVLFLAGVTFQIYQSRRTELKKKLLKNCG
jgi:hypothetical protein